MISKGVRRHAFERMVKICALARSRASFNASTLAREFEVSTKTIQRDLEFLRDRMRLPIVYHPSLHRISLDPAVKLPWWFLP